MKADVSDEVDVVKDYALRHPNALAFREPEDRSLSLRERLVLYEMEQVLYQCNESLSTRKSQYSEAEPTAASPEFLSIPTFADMQRQREEELSRIAATPSLQPFVYMPNVIESEANFALKPKNTLHTVRHILLDYFRKHAKVLAQEKYKLLSRFSRFCTRSEDIETYFPLLDEALREKEREFEYSTDMVKRMEESIVNDPNIVESDAIPFDRETILIMGNRITREFRVAKKVQRLAKKIQWLGYSKRLELLSESREGLSMEEDSVKAPNVQQIPMTLLRSTSLDGPIDELKRSFDIHTKIEAEGHEFFYYVNKKFTTVFQNQATGLEFHEYPARGEIKEGNLYLKLADWLPWAQIQPVETLLQQNQRIQLSSLKKLDHILRVELFFLESTDMPYAAKRLKEQAESHLSRCSLGKDDDDASVRNLIDFTSSPFPSSGIGSRRISATSTAGVGVSGLDDDHGEQLLLKHKLTSMYYLRYVRTREFRRKILDVLNVFRSLQRRLVCDSYGYAFEAPDERHVNIIRSTSKLARDHSVGDISSFSIISDEDLMKMGSIENRDDTFSKGEFDEIVVIDANGVPVMYDASLEDLKALETELLRLGSFYLSRMDDMKVELADRFSMLEDLFECEAWFQEAKKKLMNCYLEAYENVTDPNDVKYLAQEMVNLMNLRPRIDLNAGYFCESYANEIVILELQSSLIRELISFQIGEDLKLKDRRTSPSTISLFPGSTPVGHLDLFPSLVHSLRLHKLLGHVSDEVVSQFNVKNPLSISSIHRVFSQQAIVEWKVMMEEERIERQIRLRADAETLDKMENGLMIDQFYKLERVVDEGRSEYRTQEVRISQQKADAIGHGDEEDARSLQHHRPTGATSSSPALASSSKKKESLLSRAGFPLDSKESTTLQLLSNCIEIVYLRKNILDTLFECEVLHNIYRTQAAMMGRDVKQTQLEPLDLGRKEADERSVEKLTEVEKKRSREVISVQTDFMANLAISEFENAMAQWDFDSTSGLLRMMSEDGLEELRTTYLAQVTQKNLLLVSVRYNQVLIDMAQEERALGIFITETPREGGSSGFQPGGESGMGGSGGAGSMSSTKAFELFLSINALKIRRRSLLLKEFAEKSALLAKAGKAADTTRLRALKFEMVRTYCSDMLQDLKPFFARVQISEIVSRCRKLLEDLPQAGNPFASAVESGKKDVGKVGDEERISTSSDLVTPEGTLGDIFQLPTTYQLVKLVSSDSLPKGRKITVLENIARIMFSLHDILFLFRMRSKMSVTVVDDVIKKKGLETMVHDLSRFKIELDHVSSPTDVDSVSRFMWNKRKQLYEKFILSLRSLKDQLLAHDCAKSASVTDLALQSVSMQAYQEPLLFRENWPSFLAFCNEFNEVGDPLDESVVNLMYSGPFVGAVVRPTLTMILPIFLRLPDADRNYMRNADMELDILLDDVIANAAPLAAGRSELVLIHVLEFLEDSLSLDQRKKRFLAERMEERPMPTSERHAKADSIFNDEIVVKVKPLLEAYRAREKLVDASKVGSDAVDESSTKSLAQKLSSRIAKRSSKKFTQATYRLVLNFLLNQELSMMVIKSQMVDLKGKHATLLREVEGLGDEGLMEDERGDTKTEGGDEEERAMKKIEKLMSKEYAKKKMTKLPVLQQFIDQLMLRCVRRREGTGEIMCEVSEEHLDSSLDTLFKNLEGWKQVQVDERTETLHIVIGKMKHEMHKLEKRLQHIEHLREMDRRAMSRRVQIELADRNYDLIHQLDSLTKRNEELEVSISAQESVLREKVKDEFEEKIQGLERELMVSRGKFDEYRTYLYREMQNNLMEVKKEAMLKMVESESAPLELKRKALKIARFDDELNRIKEENMELKKTIMKMQMFHKLRSAATSGKYERRLRRATAERQKATREFWSSREKVEERENILRQQLLATQNALNAAEIELEQLRKDLHLQMKNKQQLVHWKVKNAQLLSDYEEKVKKYERWEQVDADKLLVELERREVELQKLSRLEETATRKTELLGTAKEKEIMRLQVRLAEEQRVKQQAFDRLEALRMEMEMEEGDVARAYRQRFLDARKELERAMGEIDSLRQTMEAEGLDVPDVSILFEETSLNVDPESLPPPPAGSMYSRRTSGGVSHRVSMSAPRRPGSMRRDSERRPATSSIAARRSAGTMGSGRRPRTSGPKPGVGPM